MSCITRTDSVSAFGKAPNVIGMSQFADGGLPGANPYAASGYYISKMSDHCSGCSYDVKLKAGEGALPLQSVVLGLSGVQR